MQGTQGHGQQPVGGHVAGPSVGGAKVKVNDAVVIGPGVGGAGVGGGGGGGVGGGPGPIGQSMQPSVHSL